MRTFLLSSFPTLSFDGSCPVPFKDFLAECNRHLSSSDFAELDAVCSNPPVGQSPFAKAWQHIRNQWQQVNERERAEALGLEKTAMTFPDADQLRNDLNAAWQAQDPYLREKALLRSLWNWLDTERRRAPFTPTDLMGYALQLQLLERMQLWQESEGLTQFQEHTQSFLEPVLEEMRKQELSS